MRTRFECIIYGAVQGVSFRDFTRRAAQELGITGTVENLPDGTVRVVAEGEEEGLKKLLAHLWEKHPFARVARIDETWSAATGVFSDFRIGPS